MADTVAEEVDRRTVKFLFPAELKLKKEEEKERRRQREVAAYDARMLALDRHVFRDEPQRNSTTSSHTVEMDSFNVTDESVGSSAGSH